MKREKFSPTIEQKDSILSKVKLGMGKKAAALLLTGSATFGAAACDSEGSPAPQTAVSSEAVASNTESGSVDQNEKQEQQRVFTEDDLYYELSPYTYTPYWTNAPPGTEFMLNQNDELVITRMQDYNPDDYIPQYEKNKDRSSIVTVGNETFDIHELAFDETVQETVLGSAGTTNTVKYLIGLSIYNGSNYKELIRAASELPKEEAAEIEKEYKILDENATSQEILDNYNIEMALVNRIPSQKARNNVLKYVSRSTWGTSSLPEREKLENDTSKILSGGDYSRLYNHYTAETEFDNSRDSIEVLNLRAEQLRKIYYRDKDDRPIAGEFHYTEYDDLGIGKWMMTSEYVVEEEHYKAVVGNPEREAILDKYL